MIVPFNIPPRPRLTVQYVTVLYKAPTTKDKWSVLHWIENSSSERWARPGFTTREGDCRVVLRGVVELALEGGDCSLKQLVVRLVWVNRTYQGWRIHTAAAFNAERGWLCSRSGGIEESQTKASACSLVITVDALFCTRPKTSKPTNQRQSWTLLKSQDWLESC